MKKLLRKLATVQAYAVIMFFSCLMVIVIGIVLWLVYDPGIPNSYGLRHSITELIISSMLPIVCVNLTGFRDAAFKTIVSFGSSGIPSTIRIKSGAILLYIIGFVGIASYVGCMFIISTGIEVTILT